MKKQTKRYYILGSEWLYYKLYMGPEISEEFLTSKLLPLADELIKQKVIDKWFFINYSDPDRHIRVRFHLTDRYKYVNTIVQLIYDSVAPLIDDRLITDIQTGTYKREIERYGSKTIEEFETLFFLNSRLVLKILQNIEGDPNKRWLFALKSIDAMLNDWGLNVNNKKKFFQTLESSFSIEMGGTKIINKHLSKKFRKNRSDIMNIINKENHFIDDLLLWHSSESKPFIRSIIKKNHDNQYVKLDLLTSYIHMHCNRFFNSQQRMNEWVLYLFLYKYYRSETAKLKNNFVFK